MFSAAINLHIFIKENTLVYNFPNFYMKTNNLRRKETNDGFSCWVYLDYCCGGAHGIIYDNPVSQ